MRRIALFVSPMCNNLDYIVQDAAVNALYLPDERGQIFEDA
jgi:hypothetical protein